jgi:hypothetical protein
MNFKLNSQISQTTTLETNAIIENIRFQLNEKDYRLIDVTDKSVTFDINQWALRWNFKPERLDGGKFKISTSDNYTTVILSYYNDMLTPLIVFAALIVDLLIDSNYDIIIFFAAFYFVSGIIKIIISKIKSKQLLNDILNVEVS